MQDMLSLLHRNLDGRSISIMMTQPLPQPSFDSLKMTDDLPDFDEVQSCPTASPSQAVDVILHECKLQDILILLHRRFERDMDISTQESFSISIEWNSYLIAKRKKECTGAQRPMSMSMCVKSA
eukprot:scaffold3999_cov138-Skeletonema_dohrnii-CCMP3373.AAC.24